MRSFVIGASAAVLMFGLFAGCPAPQPATDDGGVLDAGVSPSTADAGPPDFPCAANWPGPTNATVVPSLQTDGGVVKWTRTFNWTALSSAPAAIGDRIALLGGNKLFILDGSGNDVAEVPDFSSFSGSWVMADHSGHFLFATSHITSVDVDGGPNFSVSFGSLPDPVSETPIAGAAALAPDGMLYFASSGGVLHALDTRTGKFAWKRPVEEKTNNPPVWVGPGAGDVVFVAGVAHDRQSGDVLGALRDEDGGISPPGILSVAGPTTGSLREVNGAYAWTSYLFDHCGELIERIGSPATTDVVALSGFDERLLLCELSLVGAKEERWRWLPSAGDRDGGPPPGSGVVVPSSMPAVIGADGVIYAVGCTTQPQKMTVRAFNDAFEPLWSIDLPGSCDFRGPALLDDGTLVVARVNPTLEVFGIQTSSPGVAHTSWPAVDHDMGRTDWLSAP